MARKIDPTLADILKKYECDPSADIWDCHGTWVAYHRTLEKIAAKAGVKFQPPQIIESNTVSGTVAICVTGVLGDKSEWSFGECSSKNNKNAYPYSMAEKRAKDRVIIKLVGLHGVYSEDEADDFKAAPSAAKPALVEPQEANPFDEDRNVIDALMQNMRRAESVEGLRKWYKLQLPAINDLPSDQRGEFDAAAKAFQDELAAQSAKAA